MSKCGICGRPAREGDGNKRVRLVAEDMADKKYPEPKTPGLYSCCGDCLAEYLPVIEKRLGFAPGTLPYNHQI